ncbi:MAG: hypothetical protein RI990_895, partial [Planctomycetota bacterium]
NIVIILLDDVGFGQAGTYGGPIHTPTLDRIAETGISYNRFHTTALCSPTRASLLTGRNHHRVGNGVIAEMAMATASIFGWGASGVAAARPWGSAICGVVDAASQSFGSEEIAVSLRQ